MYLKSNGFVKNIFNIKIDRNLVNVHKNSFFFLLKIGSYLEIIADEMLTKKIEAVEDALGNEIYFFSLKTDRKQIDRQNDVNEERV